MSLKRKSFIGRRRFNKNQSRYSGQYFKPSELELVIVIAAEMENNSKQIIFCSETEDATAILQPSYMNYVKHSVIRSEE